MPPCQDRGLLSVPSLRISCKRPWTPCPAELWLSRTSNASGLCCFFMSDRPSETTRRRRRSVCPLHKYNVSEVVGPAVISPSKIILAAAERPPFPPLDQALIQAMACEVVAETKEPLSRQSPVASRQSPVASRQSPVASRQSPVASRQSPVASRQSPVASRQSPVAS